MIHAVISAANLKLEDFWDDREDKALTLEVAAEVTQDLQHATMSTTREGYRAFIESYELDVPTIQLNGTIYRNYRNLIS